MKQKKSPKQKTFFKSFINNRALFERRNNTILIPILILFLIVALLAVPTYFISRSVKSDALVKNFPGIEEPMTELLTSSLDCTVKKGILVCSEESPSLNIVVGDNIKYTVVANEKALALDTEIVYNAPPKDTDNLIILYNQTIRIRYAERDYVNETVKVYEILGDYSDFEGFSLKEISDKINNNPETAKSEVKKFILTAYKSTLDTQLFVNLISSVISYLLLVLVTCIVLKGSYLFKLKKGFKFIECFKISLTSALPAVVISLTFSLFIGFSSFPTIFGFIFVGRILFIYFKYILTNKIFKELYVQTEEERFNV